MRKMRGLAILKRSGPDAPWGVLDIIEHPGEDRKDIERAHGELSAKATKWQDFFPESTIQISETLNGPCDRYVNIDGLRDAVPFNPSFS